MNKYNIPSIKVIGDFFEVFSDKLCLPEYQRPYKWAEKNVTQLLNDVKEHSSKKIKNNSTPIVYRLGSIVLHHDGKGVYNIVDGQQRTVTLLLLLKALVKHYKNNKESYEKSSLSAIENKLDELVNNLCFPSEISHHNIVKNYQLIEEKVKQSQFTLEHANYLLSNCEIAIFVLSDIAEAFQFFDSQNARGKGLAPHDLLKAYHLREFKDNLIGVNDKIIEKLTEQTVQKWEDIIGRKNGGQGMHHLFEKYLYRIKRWNEGKDALTFTTNDIDTFKGINFLKHQALPYVKGLNTLYSQELNSGIKFKYQLDQPIINGYHFFEMIFEYYEKTKVIKNINGIDIIEELNAEGNHGRNGDKYTRNMFDTVIFYYFDRFIDLNNSSQEQFKSAVDFFFYWAFRIRLINSRVDKASIEKYIHETQIIKKINRSIDGLNIINTMHKKVSPKNDKYFHHEFLLNEFLRKGLLIEKHLPEKYEINKYIKG